MKDKATNENDRIQELLKKSLPPAEGKLERDLWPQMLHRFDERPHPAIPWFDWALLTAVALWLLLYPGAIPVLLYHL
jgi:hypothetical protein